MRNGIKGKREEAARVRHLGEVGFRFSFRVTFPPSWTIALTFELLLHCLSLLRLSCSPSLALSLSLLLSLSLFRFLFLDPSLSILSFYSSLSLRARNFEDTTCLERDFSTLLKWESKMAIRNFKLDCVSALVRPGMWCFMGSSYVVNAPRIVSIASFLTFGVKRSLEFRPLICPCQTDFFYLVFSLNCRKQITKL